MKKSRLFLRSFYITIIMIFCVCIFIYGITEAYKQMNAALNSHYEKALYISSGGIRILDFFISFE